MFLIFNVLYYLLVAMQIALIGRFIISWIDPTGRTPIGGFLLRITNPIIAPIRRIMPNTGFLDFSPMVAWIVVIVLMNLLQRSFPR